MASDNQTTVDDDDWNPVAGGPNEVRITHTMMAAGMGNLQNWRDDDDRLPRSNTDQCRHMLADVFRAMWMAKKEEDSCG